MKRTFRLSMRWLHTWTGLLLGWVIYVIFVTGTATYYRHEITAWMQPESVNAPRGIAAVERGLVMLERLAPDAASWSVEPPVDRSDRVAVGWREGERGRFQRAVLGGGETTLARDSRGGDFFYRFHFELQLPHPWGRYLAVAAAAFIVIALISGVVTHRRFFADFFTFRSGAGRYRATLDAHNVTAVVALPFYLMISLSGLLIFQYMIFPWVEDAVTFVESGNEPAGFESANSEEEAASSGGMNAMAEREAILSFARLAAAKWGGEEMIARVSIAERGTASAKVSFGSVPQEAGISLPDFESMEFDLLSGSFADTEEEDHVHGIASRIRSGFYGLHLARFASPGLRFGFFFMGTLGSILTATGLILWTLKRGADQRKSGKPSVGYRLVEILNVTAITGLIVAIGVYFWANRLLPLELEDRADLEVRCFLRGWAAAFVHACVRPSRRGWGEQLIAIAALFVLLPVLDLVLDATRLTRSLSLGNFAYVGCFAAWLFIGMGAAFIARRLGKMRAVKTGNSVASDKSSE